MPIETDADRAALLSASDFGVAVTYTPGGGSARTISVIFDNEALSVDPISGQTISTVNPHFICRSADLVGDRVKADRFVIGGVTYKPVDFRPDGTGMTTIDLQKA